MASTSSLPYPLLVLARALLAAVFLFSAFDKATHFAQATAEVNALGLPSPAMVAAVVIIVQLVGALMLIIEPTVRVGAVILGGFTLIATVLAHDFWNHTGPAFARELTTFLEHLGLIGGFMLAALAKQQR
jgi:putative oxidoreductase